jgi:hypothetical protein
MTIAIVVAAAIGYIVCLAWIVCVVRMAAQADERAELARRDVAARAHERRIR